MSKPLVFYDVCWITQEKTNIPSLAVAGGGVMGRDSLFTRHSYELCTQDTKVDFIDGDGVTPTKSAIGLIGAEHLILEGNTLHLPHFPRLITEKLHKMSGETSWFGSEDRIQNWINFML